MKYSLNPFRWLSYLINRIRYRYSRWLHYYASIPYTKSYLVKWIRSLDETQTNQTPKI